MASDSIACNRSPSLPKIFAKKKKTNSSAKLKKSKLERRRGQWLSQVKTKGCDADSMGRDRPPLSIKRDNGQSISLDSLENRSREDNEGRRIDHRNSQYSSSSESGSILEFVDSMKNLSGSSTSHSSSGSSVGKEELDQGCLDDWEAFADALNADDHQQSPSFNSPSKPDTRIKSTGSELPNKNHVANLSNTDIRNKVTESHSSPHAWRPDDAFRPQSLPKHSTQHGFPMSSEWHCGHGAMTWAWQNFKPQPSSCPICCEDLDITDSCFLPCLCGFRLCLFCHKRILEADARCPGCRKQYDCVNSDVCLNGGVTDFRVARSMSTASKKCYV